MLEDHGYDDDGNRVSYNGRAASYDDQDRLTARDGVAHGWDADGFLISRGTDTFSWSRGGELLSATAGGATVSYAYDGFGRRTARTDAAGTTKYLYGDPQNMLPGSPRRSPAARSRATGMTPTTACSRSSGPARCSTSAPTRSARRGS